MALDRNLLSKIAELNEQGFTQYQIASKLSKSQSTISRHLKILSRKRTKSSYSRKYDKKIIGLQCRIKSYALVYRFLHPGFFQACLSVKEFPWPS